MRGQYNLPYVKYSLVFWPTHMPFANPSCQAEIKNKMYTINLSGILFLLTACHPVESKSNSKYLPCKHRTLICCYPCRTCHHTRQSPATLSKVSARSGEINKPKEIRSKGLKLWLNQDSFRHRTVKVK